MSNDIENINNYLKNVYNTFGGKSKEYFSALNEVREILPDNVINETAKSGNYYKGDNPKSPLQFKNTINAQEIFSNFETELKQIQQYSEGKGNVEKNVQKYKDQLKYWGQKESNQNIKKWAKWEYEFADSGDDWYKRLTESEALTEEEQEEVRDLYSRVSGEYNDADFKREFFNKINKYNRKVKNAEKDEPEITGGEAVNPLDLINPLS